MAVAFTHKANRAIGQLRLAKLMYLAEREAIRRFLLPIVEDETHAREKGMVLSRTWDLAQGRHSAQSTGDWDAHIVQTAHGLNVRKGVSVGSLDSLSDDDLEVIQRVWDDYGTMKQDDLVHEVHHKLPEWTDHWNTPDRKRGSVRVSYAKLYQTICGVDETEARFLTEEYRAAQHRWITSDPEILGGTPVVVGTRVSVYAIRGRLAGGDKLDDLLKDYPRTSRAALLAAKMYAKVHPLETHPLGRPWEAPASQAHPVQAPRKSGPAPSL